jgi:hypothetical protein
MYRKKVKFGSLGNTSGNPSRVALNGWVPIGGISESHLPLCVVNEKHAVQPRKMVGIFVLNISNSVHAWVILILDYKSGPTSTTKYCGIS